MTADYARIKALAAEHGFSSFTPLQETAFGSEDFYDRNADLFIVGRTSSGKTLIPQLMYLDAVRRAAENDEDCPKMLFVVPYRALAAQKYKEFCSFFEKESLNIVQSTGEFRQDDENVRKAGVDAAVIISEKVFRYEAQDPDFLSRYDFLVLDEIGLINESARGVRLDFILAWAQTQKRKTLKPRTVALGTPFYDWSEYIKSYGFVKLASDVRPVGLRKIAIMTGKCSVEGTDGDPVDEDLPIKKIWLRKRSEINDHYSLCDDFSCPNSEPPRANASLICPRVNETCRLPLEFVDDDMKNGFNYVLVNLCRYHLRKNHRILIFINDRERVRRVCAYLYKKLGEEFFPSDPASDPREELLRDCGLEYDDVYGVLDDEQTRSEYKVDFFRAFASGIGFHSAALPNELRSYVETNFLDRPKMKIVCSTETLAFGVNSSVDVVIIADLLKTNNGVSSELTLNEFNNYAGRAGRLRRDAGEQFYEGRVYTLVKTNQTGIWEKLNDSSGAPEPLCSQFHSGREGDMPFFILSILPSGEAGAATVKDLLETVRIFPKGRGDTADTTEDDIRYSLQFLVERGLAAKITGGAKYQTRSSSRDRSVRYCLSELGRQLRGYVISREDFIAVRDAVKECMGNVNTRPDKVTFLFRLICTKHAEKALNSIFTKSNTIISRIELEDFFKNRMNDQTAFSALLSRDTDKLYVLGALIAWSEGSSPGALYRDFGVPFALLCRLSEPVSYLIEVSRTLIRSDIDLIRIEKIKNHENAYGTAEDPYGEDEYDEALKEKLRFTYELFVSVCYGVDTEIAKWLEGFIREEGTPGAEEAADYLSISRIGPETSRVLRKISIRYGFFDDYLEDPDYYDSLEPETKKNFDAQFELYKNDVKRLCRGKESVNGYIYGFFKEYFPEIFENPNE